MKKLLQHLFYPHHTNNYRPKALHSNIFLIYAVFFLALSFSFKVVRRFDSDILGFATNIAVDRLLTLTNQKRAEAGLAPLSYNQALARAAAGKANDMFVKDYWAHNSPDGKTPWDFIINAGYRYVFAGENLAKNFQDSDGVITAWMASPSHKENILRAQYDEVGFAIVNGRLQGEETTLVVQMFGKRNNSSAQVVQPVQALEITAKATPLAEIFPSPEVEVIPASKSSQIAGVYPSDMKITAIPNGGVTKKPLVNIFKFTKTILLILSMVLIGLLVVDGIYVWRRKIVRISGRNLAHIFFLTAITGIIWLTGSAVIGSVL